MKNLKYIFIISLVLFGCDYDDLNDNPNAPTEVPELLVLTGTMLADVSVNASHVQRISGLWTGQYKGLQNLYENIYNYNISTEESNQSWGFLYNGILVQNDVIQKGLADDLLIMGITKVVEAHAAGSACSNWGSIPYAEAATEGIDDPKFDSQLEVFTQLQGLLDSAISDFNGVSGYALKQDIFYNGDKDKWLALAYTLKARYYMLVKDYPSAYTAAQNGISSGDGSMVFTPKATVLGDQNLLFEVLSGSRAGDLGPGDYLSRLIGADSGSRNNAKTNEEARSKFYDFDPNGANTVGVAAADAKMPLVTYQENLLTLAEAGARTQSLAVGLGHLNELRAYLASGSAFDKIDAADALQYDAYEAADFDNGGIENTDGIDATRALIREIVEERYVSGYGTFMPWNDARRLRKTDTDVMVPFPLNNASVSEHPERFLLSQEELNSNPNAPTGKTIFDKTAINQ